MKVLILGHSDSDGSRLADSSQSVPALLQQMLAEVTGEHPTIVHRTLYAGPTARAFVERELDRHNPDVVIVCTTTHSVVVQLVSNRVRERWGDRAGRLAERAERTLASASDRLGPARSKPLRAVRKSARRLLGTRPLMTAVQMVGYYDEVMTVIASREQVQCVIGGGIGYIGAVRELNPGIDGVQAWFQQQFRRSAELHHFDWVSQEQVLGGPGTKDQYYQPDGMHTDERSHRLFAAALLPFILAHR